MRPPSTSDPNFNPRSREGSDQGLAQLDAVALHFNPRSHEGSDALRSPGSLAAVVFQSTLP